MEHIFIYFTELSSGVSYIIVFLVLVACGLGLPIPEDIPLVATGYLCWTGTMHWPLAVTVTIVGVLLGDSVLYLIGNKLGGAILAGKKVEGFISAKKVNRGRAYFRKFGPKIVFYARFVMGVRAAVYFTAGAMKMAYKRFILLDGLAALLSVPIWIALGYWLGHRWGTQIESLLNNLEQFKSVITVIIIAAVLFVLVRFYLNYRKSKKLA